MARAKRLSALLVAAVVVSSCGANSQPEEASPATDLGPPVQYSSLWTAGNVDDLFDRAGELVRASVEAGEYAVSFGAHGQFDDFPPFPGYLDAIGTPVDGDPRFSRYYYEGSPKEPNTYKRMKIYHLAQLTTDGRTIDATVCALGSTVTEDYNVTSLSSAIHVQLSTTAENPGLPGIRDADLDATDPPAHIIPSWNVFGDWKINGMVNAALTNDRSLQAPCFDWWRIQFPNLPENMQYPTAPEDYLQYPEWIGPAEAS